MRFSEAMEETIRTRVPRGHKQRLANLAAQRGLTLSELVRKHFSDLIEAESA